MSLRAFTDPLVGRRVRVVSRSYYDKRCEGETGTVRACWSTNSIAVDLDLLVNENSKHGYFYFKASELEVLNEMNEMNEKTATAAEGEKMEKFTNYLNVAEVHFLDDDQPFRTIECANYDTAAKEGGLCIVMTAHHGMGLAEIVSLKDRPAKELCREIVAAVDTFDYYERVERRKKTAELKMKMRERAKQLQDVVLYQTLAEKDPEMAQLLADFQALGM